VLLQKNNYFFDILVIITKSDCYCSSRFLKQKWSTKKAASNLLLFIFKLLERII